MPTAPPSHRHHHAQPKKAWQRREGTTTERGYGANWRKIRLVIIRRDNGLCQPCKRQNIITAFDQVDHIIPKAKGGTDDDDNLECICNNCHKAKTARHDSKI